MSPTVRTLGSLRGDNGPHDDDRHPRYAPQSDDLSDMPGLRQPMPLEAIPAYTGPERRGVHEQSLVLRPNCSPSFAC